VRNLTIVLPTFNEKENLEYLLPQILESTWPFPSSELQVVVVDDRSTDGTSQLVNKIRGADSRVILLERNSAPSLPLSIWEGIQFAPTEYVAWLDADGSMPIADLVRFVAIAHLEDVDVVIGSRFVVGGGYKGLNVVGRTSIMEFYKNIRNSQDSVVAVILSRCLNEFLRLVLRAGVRDLTSGFIVARKSFIASRDFEASYGDYCPILIRRLVFRGAAIREIGYTCLPRAYGVSKTGSSLYTYLRRGFPYLWSAVREILRSESKHKKVN
jgi:dolichol-phosphate mannosyltransferase